MPTKIFYLDEARTDAVTAKWGMFYRNFTVHYAGTPLAASEPGAAIAKGRSYHLPDGRTFIAQLKTSTYPQELELLIDGQPIFGSSTHPQERLKQAWYTLLFIGVLDVSLGLAAEFGQIEMLQRFGLGWGSLVEGTAFLALGWVGYSRRSATALAVAFALLVLDGIVIIGWAVSTGQKPSLGSLFMRFYFCLMVFRGMKAARQLRKEEAMSFS
ncbi:hypothetical protein IC235_21580 [Hymenobacter sp. BT664]|uniref:Uncharacterized protein n=1 Tax=Hymenobacter montanus TaxID=2771359 RepID=A0A927GLS9_9BACT|nr:hypothetical protein [Hymenobacter montanus]MBD2770484.1 hypothetical protein [Hymenobacter montanus]